MMETLTRCTRCSREVPIDAHFCPGCGLDLRDGRVRPGTGLLPTNKNLHSRYVVLRRLAQGGQSAVYLVMDALEGGEKRAIKEMSESNLGPLEREQAINDFIREANMLSQLTHQSLAKVHETFVEGQKHYLVMEYVDGHNLEDELISTGRPLDWPRVLEWGIALCDVLVYVHSQNPPIIYRDLKPANVMLTPDGAIKLIDFGIARRLHPARARDTSQLGTDGYAPLEQYSSRSEPRSDIYALGASLYHLLTGRVPEAAPTRVAGQSLTPLRMINPRVPESFERVIMRAMQLNARDRYQSALDMRVDLERVRLRETGVAALRHQTYGPAAPHSSHLTNGMRPTAAPANIGIGRSTPLSLPPRLHIWPLRLDAGYLEPQESTTLLLEITNRGGGRLSGHTETNMRCLTVEPGEIEPEVSSLQVRIDSAGLRAGPYMCHLAVRTNGGDQIVPVRFTVRPPIDTMGPQRRPTGM